MDELRNIYDEKLIDVIFSTRNYNLLEQIKDFNEYILNDDFIKKFADKIIKIYSDEKKVLGDEYCRDNILTVINNIRFNYNYRSFLEKEKFYDIFNECILTVNRADVTDSVLEVCDSRELSKQREMQLYFLYYYLQDNDTFLEEGVLFFCLADYYVPCLVSLLIENPNLLKNTFFLKRTKVIIDTSLSKEAQVECPDSYKRNGKSFERVKNILFK